MREPSAKKLKIAVEKEAQTMLYNVECAVFRKLDTVATGKIALSKGL